MLEEDGEQADGIGDTGEDKRPTVESGAQSIRSLEGLIGANPRARPGMISDGNSRAELNWR